LKNFSKEFKQNRETTETFCSKKYKIGAYNWALGAKVEKHIFNNEYNFVPYLRFSECEYIDQSYFPVDAYVKFGILNQEKGSRIIYSKGTSNS
jgi:hypothetical protein